MIFILDRQGKIVNILKNNGGVDNTPPFFDDTLTEDLTTGSETFQFSTIAMGNVSRDLTVGNFVAFKKDGKFKLFQIMQVEETHEDVIYMSVYCEGAGLELINKVFRKRTINSATLRMFLDTVLSDTGWQTGFVEATSVSSVDLELEDSSVYATLQNNISKFNCELEFRVEISGGRITGKYVDAFGNRGKVTGKRFVFGQDIEGLTRKTDSTELYTALIGKGSKDINFRDITIPGIDKPLGQDFVADQESYERYNHNGYHIMGIFEFDTESPEELLRETYKQLQKVKEPKYEYEISVALLGILLGEKWNTVSIGDTVAIVDNAFNPPIHLMARVSKLETSFTNPQGDVCTLSNFIEVKSNITNEMRKIASELEGYVDGAIGSKFPIGGDDIQQGAVNGGHIFQNSITTDHLLADCVTADKIDANQIYAKHIVAGEIKADHIDAKQIKADHIDTRQIKAEHIETGTITAESGIIGDLAIGTAQIRDAEITVAKIQNAFINDLVVAQGKFQSAHIGILTSDNIDANTIKAEHIKASVIDAINLNVAGKISADKIDVTNLKVENVDAGKITTGSLSADRIKTSVITAINGSLESATINSAKIGNLSADKITTGTLTADVIKGSVVQAINLSTAQISASRINTEGLVVKNIDATNITSGNISADRLKANIMSAISLSAGKISATNIDVGSITIGNANIVEGTINGAKIEKASITGAKIGLATIDSANIREVFANKIKSGTVETGELSISSIDGSLKIQGNIIQIKDNQTVPVTRVQIGKDTRGQYGILVMNSKGEAIFDSEIGVMSDKGLNDGVVSRDKIVQGSIDSTRLNIDELFVGENAFIRNLKAVKISADNIETGTISNKCIDLEGFITFKHFDSKMKDNFTYDVTGDKTYINGGMIATNTIKANSIDLLSGLTVQGEDGTESFSIDSTGEVRLSGLIKSSNFDLSQQTGFQLTKDGDAVLNKATVRGNVILPNAGLTNDYDMSQIQGRNLIPMSRLSGIAQKIDDRSFRVSSWAGELLNNSWVKEFLLPSTKYTFSAKIKVETTSALAQYSPVVGLYLYDGSTGVDVYLGQTNISQGEVPKEYVIKNTFTTPTSLTSNYRVLVYTGRYTDGVKVEMGTVVFSEVKLEKGEKATEFTLPPEDNLNPVRIWAGSKSETKDSAPFRVYQDGSVFATKGTFDGTHTGKIQIGNISIEDTNTTNGAIMIKTNNDIETRVSINDSLSIFDTDFILGSLNNKSVQFLKEDKSLNVTDTNINFNGGWTNVKISKENSWTNGGLQLGTAYVGQDNRVNFGYSSADTWKNTLIITSQGSKGVDAYGDICFRRVDTSENIDVNIMGDLKIKDKLTSSTNPIEMRSVSGEGWGFYAN